MSRLLRAMRTDAVVQWRNGLYLVGLVAALLLALALSRLATPASLGLVVPTVMLLVVGGSTLLYVAGLIIFEKDEGTLRATLVSPLRRTEYLWSKIMTLSALATLEGLVIVVGTLLLMPTSPPLPELPLLLVGIAAIGLVYTLVGIILVVRFDTITDTLIPLGAAAAVLQSPVFHFLDWVPHAGWLVIPTSAPAMLMRGAFLPLDTLEWIYAWGYTAVSVLVLTGWAYRGFDHHIPGRGR